MASANARLIAAIFGVSVKEKASSENDWKFVV
jgi:hypothetical protein